MGVCKSINHALLLLARETRGREASPSAGAIDSQSENNGKQRSTGI